MSRFTVNILLATALLGVLLWIVVSTVAELANPTPLVILEEPAAEPEFDASLPLVTSRQALIDWLATEGLDGAALISDFGAWRSARGFPAGTHWTDQAAPADTAAEQGAAEPDDASLLTRAGNGDIEAVYLLAERSKGSNPVDALDWYDLAVVNGSLYAMLRVSDLLTTLGDPALADFTSDPVWQQALEEINAQTPAPLERALAWSIAAVNVGGYAIIDATHANRIDTLVGRLDPAGIERACETAEEYVLQTAMARRAQGGAVFSVERPLFAVSVAAPETHMPCDVPVPPLVEMNNCLTRLFVGPDPELWQAWFCPSS